tara:strand:+ start:1309 stop:1503 length:195 start_codon:yes stop_codon:yes gene_type:complete
MAICYSTDPKEMAKIKAKRPKYRPTDKQKFDWSTEDCRRFGSAYQSKVEMQKIENRFKMNHHEE